MKKNLITEIKKIKNLINILESTDTDCEEQLEKKGYVVYNPNEQSKIGTKCKEKSKIKCVLETLGKIYPNISDKLFVQTTGSMCYIEIKHPKKIKHGNMLWNKLYFNFWEDGDFTIVETFEEPIKKRQDSPYNIIQFMFQGDYECDSDNEEIKIKNMKYRGFMYEKNTKKIIKDDLEDSKGEKISTYYDSGTYDITEFF